MAGRILPPEDEFDFHPLSGPDFVRRRAVLRETLEAFESGKPLGHYRDLAERNLRRWRTQATVNHADSEIQVLSGDWGEVAADLSKTHGECFAVLNMANASEPGGGYVEGLKAQEENLFRRTDCHFSLGPDDFDRHTEVYHPEFTRLLSGADGRVYLDVDRPRTCLRGPEELLAEDLGYRWLAEDEVFPFYELRAAAEDLRGGSAFDPVEMRRRIAAQLDTLIANKIRHAVLSAFGCGAFCNPAEGVANLYRQELDKRRGEFSQIAFAIFDPGYGPDNFTPFARAFGGRAD
jgi:hypothetical protein